MEAIRQHLVTSLKGGVATDTFEEIIKEIPADKRFEVPTGGERSAWQIVDHIRFTLEDLIAFTDNEDGTYQERPWPEGYWPKTPVPAAADGWEKSVKGVQAARDRMIDLVQDEGRDLTKPFPWGDGQSLLHEALLAIDHTAYHLGQLVELTRWLHG